MLWLATVWDTWKARHEKLKTNSNSTKDRFTPPRLDRGHEPWASLKSTFFKPTLISTENEHHYLPWLKFIHNHSWLSCDRLRDSAVSHCKKRILDSSSTVMYVSSVCCYATVNKGINIWIIVIDQTERNVETAAGLVGSYLRLHQFYPALSTLCDRG